MGSADASPRPLPYWEHACLAAIIRRGTCRKRLGTPQDIVNAVVFFASELAGFVKGQVLAVDGGE